MGSDTAPLRRGRNTGDDGHFHPMQIDKNSSSASDGRLDRGDARGEERSLSDETEGSTRVGCLYSSKFSVSSDSFT